MVQAIGVPNYALTPQQAASITRVPAQAQPMAQTTTQQVPASGLAGAEQARQAGLGAGVSALEQGTQGALNLLGQTGQQANQQLSNAANLLGGNFSTSAVNVDPTTGQQFFTQAAEGVGAFAPGGLTAQQRQLALSGALGQDAFDQAFVEDPGQAYLREQGQRAVLNAATATGGTQGGNVLAELQRQGQGLAATNLQQQINNLGTLSNQGLQAAGQQGQFLSQAGQQQGNLAAQNAQLGTQVNLANAANRLGAAQGQANLLGQGAGITSSLGSQGAGLLSGAGQNAANLFYGTGQAQAGDRLQAGRDIASQIGQTSSGLSNLINQQGSGLSDIIGSGASNVGNLLSGFGQLDANAQQQLASILANISTGTGSQVGQAQANIGQANAAGITGQQQGLIQGLLGLGGLFS